MGAAAIALATRQGITYRYQIALDEPTRQNVDRIGQTGYPPTGEPRRQTAATKAS